MDKKLLPFSILLLGTLLIAYGFIAAPLSNTEQIRSLYACDRRTKELRSTDVYCAKPESAPEAKKKYTNAVVYSGVALIVVASLYKIASTRSKNK
jgi:hypothetical protein